MITSSGIRRHTVGAKMWHPLLWAVRQIFMHFHYLDDDSLSSRPRSNRTYVRDSLTVIYRPSKCVMFPAMILMARSVSARSWVVKRFLSAPLDAATMRSVLLFYSNSRKMQCAQGILFLCYTRTRPVVILHPIAYPFSVIRMGSRRTTFVVAD